MSKSRFNCIVPAAMKPAGRPGAAPTPPRLEQMTRRARLRRDGVFALQVAVRGGVADEDGELSRLLLPRVALDVPERHGARWRGIGTFYWREDAGS